MNAPNGHAVVQLEGKILILVFDDCGEVVACYGLLTVCLGFNCKKSLDSSLRFTTLLE